MMASSMLGAVSLRVSTSLHELLNLPAKPIKQTKGGTTAANISTYVCTYPPAYAGVPQTRPSPKHRMKEAMDSKQGY
jgi:hypothetical protein